MARLYATALYLYLPFLLFSTVYSAHGNGWHRTRSHKLANTIRNNLVGSPPSFLGKTTAISSREDSTINTMKEKRVAAIISSLCGTNDTAVSSWLSTLDENGQWPDVNYATGCAAQRANWPAQEHWSRTKILAGAWHGGVCGLDDYVNDMHTLNAILLAMKWWFDHDFTNPACIDHGGTAQCPCNSTETAMFNTNWYSNVIGTPTLVIQACLLVEDVLPQEFRDHGALMARRAYGVFSFKPLPGYVSGANILDIAKVGIDLSLFTFDDTLLSDAYRRVHEELAIRSDVMADGIRPDGSFGQHGGILYNGNYGKDYSNDAVDLEVLALGTEFSADDSARTALNTLFDGDQWMVFFNTVSKVFYWDFSVLGRFISFPVADKQATGGLLMNLTAVSLLGDTWNSSALRNFGSLSDNNNTVGANAGKLEGNRMFYNNDYMVHRSKGHVTTLKMYSSRTKNTECTNSQNPFGFHLSDGAVHTYQRGTEYEDISAAWDWDMIPGTTVDYGGTPLTCDHTGSVGASPFVGGVSTGCSGLAVMRYTNPYTKALRWQKAWFFLEDDVQHVMISDVASDSQKPVYSILDQKRHSGSVAMNSEDDIPFSQEPMTQAGPSSLWHDNVGYVFERNSSATLTVRIGERTGDWHAIGISNQPPAKVDLFSAWLEHDPKHLDTPISYTVFPGVDCYTFRCKSREFTLRSTVNDAHVSAIYHEPQDTVMVAFWDYGGGSATLTISTDLCIVITATHNIALIYDRRSETLFVSDPSQSIDSVEVTILLLQAGQEECRKDVVVNLPRDGSAGSTVRLSV